MKLIQKSIFESLIGGYSLFDNDLYNYGAMAIIGLIAFFCNLGHCWRII